MVVVYLFAYCYLRLQNIVLEDIIWLYLFFFFFFFARFTRFVVRVFRPGSL